MARVVDRFPALDSHPYLLGEFKVDLDMVDATIRRVRGVRGVATAARYFAGHMEITAYVSLSDHSVTVEELRAHSHGVLPPYMVPDRFLIVVELPDLSGGIVDESALLAPKFLPENGTPKTRREAEVIRIWRELLGREAIGLEDNFFHLGGHSLLAVRSVALVEKRLGVRIPLNVFFKHPTLAGMLAAIAATAPARAPRGVCMAEIQPQGSKPPIFWAHTLGGGGGAGLFSYYSIIRRLGDDQPSFGFVAAQEPAKSIEEMAAVYIAELRAVQPAGPYYFGGYCFGGVVAFEVARQLRKQNEEVALLALIESLPPNVTSWGDLLSVEQLLHAVAVAPKVAVRCAQKPKETALIMKRRMERVARGLLDRHAPVDPTRIRDLGDLVDFSRYPSEFRSHAEAHWEALKRYSPGFYDRAITLFHTDDARLLKPAPARQWLRVAATVRTHIIPGEHGDVLSEPYVSALAVKFRRALVAAQRAQPGGASFAAEKESPGRKNS